MIRSLAVTVGMAIMSMTAQAGIVRFTAKHIVKPTVKTTYKVTKFTLSHIIW